MGKIEPSCYNFEIIISSSLSRLPDLTYRLILLCPTFRTIPSAIMTSDIMRIYNLSCGSKAGARQSWNDFIKATEEGNLWYRYQIDSSADLPPPDWGQNLLRHATHVRTRHKWLPNTRIMKLSTIFAEIGLINGYPNILSPLPGIFRMNPISCESSCYFIYITRDGNNNNYIMSLVPL